MVVLAGTRSGLVDVVAGDVRAFAGREVVAVDGPWAVLDGRDVVRRPPGASPGDPAGPPPVEGPALRCVAAVDEDGSTAVVGTAGAHLLVCRDGRAPEESAAFEAADGRGDWYTPWGGPPDVRTASAAEGTILVNVHVGGIVRSTDAGASWGPTIDIHADVHQVLALGGGRAVAACAYGLATSTDDGLTWTVTDHGLHASYARSVAVAGDTVLLAVSDGPAGTHPAVYRRPLAGDGRFERCRSGLPDLLGGNVDTGWMAGAADGTAAFATPAGAVFVSGDEGASWEQVAEDVPAVRCLVLE